MIPFEKKRLSTNLQFLYSAIISRLKVTGRYLCPLRIDKGGKKTAFQQEGFRLALCVTGNKIDSPRILKNGVLGR